ncbi:hypothetical protein Celaphus_00017802 [Cervus elaphus hippelaphus]|uniref:Uncharacterized protein n=1 Tax=Cervus elaphus hippelaphus TaxID=46360 RepID=A0A212C7A0_CEREH|nr:hypothetical protein Celaphus_00017802 [Cervus elaphus hippelaphus]
MLKQPLLGWLERQDLLCFLYLCRQPLKCLRRATNQQRTQPMCMNRMI